MRALALILALWGGLAGAETCRQALAIGLDVSGSVDAREYALQLQGLAGALEDPEVIAALAGMPEAPVAVSVFEWSGAGFQRGIVPWVRIEGRGDVARIAATLRGVRRASAPPETAIGAAMAYGGDHLAAQGTCRRLTLDLTGDGPSNDGPRPRDTPVTAAGREVTVNALVIGPAMGGGGMVEGHRLAAYFRAEVIRGPEAFVEIATGFEAFEAAMIRKLLMELTGMRIGGATGTQAPKG